VSEPAISVAFFDPPARLFASARSGIGAVFEGDDQRVLREPPALARDGAGWIARLEGGGELRFAPSSAAVDLEGARTRVCRVRGRLGGRGLACLGAVTETFAPPTWADLDATRWLVAVFDAGNALVVSARRARGAPGHGEESVSGALVDDGAVRGVEAVRVSTVYDGDVRQRSAGLELWLPGEEFPRRAAGEARAGMSLALEGLQVQLAMFTWRMDGLEGAGAYELTLRDEARAAA
jgi:hypothetical protein